jgi:outer membrane protein insertion porin family
VVLLILVAAAGAAAAQPGTAPPIWGEETEPVSPAPPPGDDDDGPIDGGKLEPLPELPKISVEPPPVRFAEWIVTGELIDDPAAVRSFLAPEMEVRQAMTNEAREDLRRICKHIGYELVDLRLERSQTGRVVAVLDLIPVLVVQRVSVDLGDFGDSMKRIISFEAVFADDIVRRMRLRPGAELSPFEDERTRELDEEEQRIGNYLRDEGWFDAKVDVRAERHGAYAAQLDVAIDLGTRYKVGTVTVLGAANAPSEEEITSKFRHKKLVLPFGVFKFLDAGFSRQQFSKDLAAVIAYYKGLQFPAVKVSHDLDSGRFDRKTHQVNFTINIEERRQLNVLFEGNDEARFPDDELRKLTTFAAEGSYDDVEAESSAVAIRDHYQSRGYFEVDVTWQRARFPYLERIIFTIDEGPVLRVRERTFQVYPVEGDTRAFTTDQLAGVVQSERYDPGFFSRDATVNASSALLRADVERLVALYRNAGFLEATVEVQVARHPKVRDNAAVLAGLVAAGTKANGLYIRFIIVEGRRTEVEEVTIELEDERPAIPATELASLLTVKQGAPFVEGQAMLDGSVLERTLEARGHQQARVTTTILDGADPFHKRVVHRVVENPAVKFRKLILRGNFRSRDWIIRDELDFREGEVVSTAAYEIGVANLRSTGLFSSVKVELEDEDRPVDGNVVVRVEERYDHKAAIELSTGASTDTGGFIQAGLIAPNFRGLGLRLETQLTVDLDRLAGDIDELVIAPQDFADTRFLRSFDLRVKAPRWIARNLVGASFDSEISFFVRNEDTERFGDLLTIGLSTAVSKTWRQGLLRDISATLRLDLRQRNRDDELVRPAGASDDIETTRLEQVSGTVGLALGLDRLRDDAGRPNPINPSRGYKLEGSAALASSWLFSEDSFVKLGAEAVVLWRMSPRLLLKNELRYNQGIPFGSALLPEVERFFAGGDTTVRGFSEDRLAIEVIESAVPPLGEVSQLRVLPAGGNIRALHTIDIQVRLGKLWGIPTASGIFLDTGIVTNSIDGFEVTDLRHGLGVALFRAVSPFGTASVEYAVPLDPQRGDNPNGRLHINFGLRF